MVTNSDTPGTKPTPQHVAEKKGTNRYTPQLVVEENKTFSIPLYQRLFSWRRENVSKLLYDIKEHYATTPDAPYYIGMLTCITQRDKTLLIDGQQRMTVMVLLSLIFQWHDGWKCFLSNGERIDFTARSDDKDYIRREKKRIESTARSDDKEYIRREIAHQDHQYVNVNMSEAITTITAFMEKEFTNDEQRRQFVDYIYTHLTFFISSLPSNYAYNGTLLNKYFEAMNSQGRNLEQHEILKVNLLKGMSEQDVLTQIWNIVSQMDKPIIKYDADSSRQDYAAKYKRHIDALQQDNTIDAIIKTIEDCRGNKEEKLEGYSIGNITAKIKSFTREAMDDGSQSIISFEEFLMMMLYITTGNDTTHYADYQTDKLLEKFADLQKNDEATLKVREQFFGNLLRYRLLLDYYIIRREYKNGGGSYSLLLKGDDSNDEHEDNNAARLRQYQSMLYVSTAYYQWLRPLMATLATGTINTPEEILAYLQEEDNKRHPKEDMTSWCYQNINRYWFWRLDYYLWDSREQWCTGENARYKDAVSKYIFRANRSIEHFHPQDEAHNEN